MASILPQMRRYIGTQMDAQASAYSKQVAEVAGKLVANKLKEFLYVDGDKYVIDGNGDKLKVYLTKSPIIDKLFKEVTGKSLTEYLGDLPVGIKHLSGYLRNKFEMMVINLILEEVSKVSVGAVVEKALSTGYRYAKGKVAEADLPVKDLLNGFKAEVERREAVPAPELTEEQNVTLVERREAVPAPELTEEQNVTLYKVFNYYKFKIQEKLNGVVQEALAYGVEEAGRQVAEASVSSAISHAKAAAVIGAGSALSTGNVGLAVGGMAIQAGLNEVRKSWVKTAGEKAADQLRAKVTPVIRQSDFIPVDRDSSGEYVTLTQQYADDEGDIGEWEEVSYRSHSLCTWMYDSANRRVNNLTEYFAGALQKISGAASVMQSKMSPVARSWGGWVRDSDHEKLVAVREAYVSCEKALYSLELETMEAVEYARGQRGECTVEGLTRWEKRLKEIQERIEQAKKELHDTVSRISVDNAFRKKPILTEGDKLIAESVNLINGELSKFDKAKREADLAPFLGRLRIATQVQSEKVSLGVIYAKEDLFQRI